MTLSYRVRVRYLGFMSGWISAQEHQDDLINLVLFENIYLQFP